ncbi:unnamed protein product [Symbiodinium natans]|uniref:Uncharacterized protein n=1 Tax=Symbiodinium natans TaxID=878477 RepID=A0A812JG18_9DINO|nr:unnamed protein product [Symbiodinium natans]
MPSPSRSASDPRTGLPGKDAYSRWLDPVEFKVVLKGVATDSWSPDVQSSSTLSKAGRQRSRGLLQCPGWQFPGFLCGGLHAELRSGKDVQEMPQVASSCRLVQGELLLCHSEACQPPARTILTVRGNGKLTSNVVESLCAKIATAAWLIPSL